MIRSSDWLDRMCQGDAQKAEQYLRRALTEAREGFGDQDAHVASAQNNLAELYRLTGQYDKAQLLYDEVQIFAGYGTVFSTQCM